jgi:hypothetical protein
MEEALSDLNLAGESAPDTHLKNNQKSLRELKISNECVITFPLQN